MRALLAVIVSGVIALAPLAPPGEAARVGDPLYITPECAPAQVTADVADLIAACWLPEGNFLLQNTSASTVVTVERLPYSYPRDGYSFSDPFWPSNELPGVLDPATIRFDMMIYDQYGLSTAAPEPSDDRAMTSFVFPGQIIAGGPGPVYVKINDEITKGLLRVALLGVIETQGATRISESLSDFFQSPLHRKAEKCATGVEKSGVTLADDSQKALAKSLAGIAAVAGCGALVRELANDDARVVDNATLRKNGLAAAKGFAKNLAHDAWAYLGDDVVKVVVHK